MRSLILGGARSGKSRLAEQLASASGLPVTYIATSQPLDGEMNERVLLHRQRRPDDWGLIEEPLALAACRSGRRPLPAGGLPDPVVDQPADA